MAPAATHIQNFREELFTSPKVAIAPARPTASQPSAGGSTASLDGSSLSSVESVNIVSVSVDLPVDRTTDIPLPALTSSPPLLLPTYAAAPEAIAEPVLSPVEKALTILRAFKPAYWQVRYGVM